MVPQNYPEIYQSGTEFRKRFQELRAAGYLLADLHVHSAQSDGIHSLKSLAALAEEQGFSIAVTDHNRIPDLRGLTKEESARLIPAIEVTSCEFVDILAYFYDFEALSEFYQAIVQPHRLRPYLLSLSCNQILAALRQRTCVVAIPHPDYPADSLRMNFMRLFNDGGVEEAAMAVIHGIEVFNASRERLFDEEKMQLASLLDKVPLVGSDAHSRAAAGNSLMYCRATNHNEFLDRIVAGQARGISMPTPLHVRSLPKLKMAWLHIKGLLGRV